MLKLLYFFVSAIATLCSAFSSWWTKRNKGEMTGGGELKYCRKGLSQNPSHLAHNHTMKFEVYIHLSCIWDVQPIKVFVMRTWPEMRTEKQSNYWAKEKRNAQSKTTKLWCFLSPHNNKKSPLFPCFDRAPSFKTRPLCRALICWKMLIWNDMYINPCIFPTRWKSLCPPSPSPHVVGWRELILTQTC